MNDIAISSLSKYLKICILTLIFTLCSLTLKAQTGKSFVFHGSKSKPGIISSVTNLPNGKFAYVFSGIYFFKIIISDTNGNELLSRKFSGAELSFLKIIYHKGYIYGLTTSYIDGDSTLRKASLVLFKLDTCLNLAASKLVYNRNPDAQFSMYLQPNNWNEIGINDKEEFFFTLVNLHRPRTESTNRNNLILFDSLLNIRFLPYYYALETKQSAFRNKRYQMTGFYYQVSNIDTLNQYLKPFYSEFNPNSEELNMWVVEQFNDSICGYLSSLFYPDKNQMYANVYGITAGLGGFYSHGILNYEISESSTYSILSDSSFSVSVNQIIPDWPSKKKFVIIDESNLKNNINYSIAKVKVRSYNENNVQIAEQKIYGWGNLKNGLDDTFSIVTVGTLPLSNNKLFIYGLTYGNQFGDRPFYYVIDSQLNFAKKKIDTSIYHCGRTRILPAAVIVTKDTFFLTNDMFKEAKMTIHNIKLGKINYTASLPFEKPLELKKSNRLLIKYLPNNNVTCNLLGTNSSFQYKVYDMSGKLVYSGNSYDNTVTLKQSDYIPGVYILSITKNNENYSEKIQIR
jgi:hypothetical protein